MDVKVLGCFSYNSLYWNYKLNSFPYGWKKEIILNFTYVNGSEQCGIFHTKEYIITKIMIVIFIFFGMYKSYCLKMRARIKTLDEYI